MPVITVYRHGLSVGTPPAPSPHLRAKRKAVAGWTDQSTRSNTRFLYSVDERQLAGYGVALSLTVRDCPESSVHFHKIRRAFLMRLTRLGMVRGHWLVEWQRRGVPHIHAAVWFDRPVPGHVIAEQWVAVAASYGAGIKGQHCATITESVGWFKYLSKHAVRGLKHYQRASENMPQGWKTSGRMWGHVGQWPVIGPIRFNVDHGANAAYRRLVRSWRTADARASGDVGRIVSARRMLECHQRELSTVRGLSEWVPEFVAFEFVRNLSLRGYLVEC